MARYEKRDSMSNQNDEMSGMGDGSKGGTYHRKRACKFCSDAEYILDYKDAKIIQSFISEHGKILPRRISGNCASHQRKLTTAVKRARNLALVGYIGMGA